MLKVNIAQKAKNDLPNKYKCEVCTLTFKTKTLFRHKHCNFEDRSLSFMCEDCIQMWEDEERFEHHMKQKHIKHTCVWCNAKLDVKENLNLTFYSKYRAF